MKVEYIDDICLGLSGEGEIWRLPKCPNCGKYPTYNMNPCPYCGEELEYPKEINKEE